MEQHTIPLAEPVEAGHPAAAPACEGREGAVLETLRGFREEAIRREQALVLLAVEWARLFPAPHAGSRGDPLYYDALSSMELMWDELAQRGCPHIDDLSIPAFAEAAGLTEFQAGRLIREAILLVFLLPKVWRRTSQGQLEVWRARKLAEDCWGLAPGAIAYIDRQMSHAAARHTEGGRAGIITEARARYMPAAVAAEEEAAKEKRCVHVDWEEYPRSGVAAFWGMLDIPDAQDLEAAIQSGAEALANQGSDAPLHVRRSWALGDLARAARYGAAGGSAAGTVTPQVAVYLHLTPEALIEPERADRGGAGLPPIRVEGAGIPSGTVLTPETVRGWFNRPSQAPGPKVTFRPVIDLSDHQHVEAYEVPDRIKEHVGLRDGGCVFPWCHRKARRSDCDHVIPWKEDGRGGPTCSCNLAPLCRRHHRAKTHADNHEGSRYTWWKYESLGEGKYLWRGPGGNPLLRTNSGVYDVTAEHVPSRPLTPPTVHPTLLARIPEPEEFDHRFPPEAEPVFWEKRSGADGSGAGEDDPWAFQRGRVPEF